MPTARETSAETRHQPDDVATPDLPAAVLWDMDGTLVDTEPAWIAAERGLVAEFGGVWTEEDALSMVGSPLLGAAAILQRHGVDLPLEEIVDRLLADVEAAVARELVWRPGALELLAELRAAGVPCALVTMSYRRFAEAVLAQGAAEEFTVLVTGDEVTQDKPHPEPYLRAARLLGVDVTRCVAIEDSRTGVASALASGARTLGVRNVVDIDPAPGLSRAGSLAGIGLAEIRRIASGEVLDLLDQRVA